MSNCLFYSLWYRFTRGGKIKADWDSELCWYHYYIIDGQHEIHCEQKNEGRWTPLFEYEIKVIKIRKKNK